MEFTPRRVLLFLVFSALVLLSWKNFVIEPMREAQKRQAERNRLAEAENTAEEETKKDDPSQKKKSPADNVNGPAVAEKPGEIAKAVPEKPAAPAPKPEPEKPKVHPEEEVALGSLDPESGYFYKVILTSTGAAVKRIELNDPRYRELYDPEIPLSIIQPIGEYETFQTAFYRVNSAGKDERETILKGSVNWDVVKPEKADPTKARFEYVIPGKYRFIKEYTLKPATEDAPTEEQRDSIAEGYFLHLLVTVENLQEESARVQYELQGPVGMPLENAESTRKFRDIRIGAVGDGEIIDGTDTVKDLVDNEEDDEVETWAAPYRYVGVDGQFFATLLYNEPSKGPTTEKIAKYVPQVLRLDTQESEHSEISLLFTSNPIELGPEQTKSDEYTLFAGPKRQAILDKMEAGEVLEFGWFGWISKGMLAIMSFLHDKLFLPYGLAIIGLTILVRGALFPLSKKQAHSAKRMKELQPRIQELKKKYGDDKQAFAQAQWDLFKKAGYNPFAGCLPMVLQLPIFIGLYSALSHAVDLRAAPFLWINDLASPDQLFEWPGGIRLPFLGHYFNLLPLVTVGLFLVQQKLFMPAPDPDDEQAQMQHKVMNFMMIFMGFLFYHVPAGLCVYFIASSLWSVGERKLLDYGKSEKSDAADGDKAESTKATGGWLKSIDQNGQKKRGNTASKKRGKKSKTRR